MLALICFAVGLLLGVLLSMVCFILYFEKKTGGK